MHTSYIHHTLHNSSTLGHNADTHACLCTDCLREANATLEQGKRFCVTIDLVRGGAPLSEVENECNRKMRNDIFGPPDARRDVIVWHRIKDVCPQPRVSTAPPSSSPCACRPHLDSYSRVLASRYYIATTQAILLRSHINLTSLSSCISSHNSFTLLAPHSFR